MKRLTNPVLTFEIPANILILFRNFLNNTQAKVTFKQGNQIVFIKSTENGGLTYNSDKQNLEVFLTSEDTGSLSPGVVKMELAVRSSLGEEAKDLREYISDIMTVNVEDVLNTGWEDWG